MRMAVRGDAAALQLLLNALHDSARPAVVCLVRGVVVQFFNPSCMPSIVARDESLLKQRLDLAVRHLDEESARCASCGFEDGGSPIELWL